jgi:hypothetical protein
MKAEEITELYQYGMRLRGCSPGAQPKDFYYYADTDKATTGYWSMVYYTRELTPEEIERYSLVFIQKMGGDIING